MIESPFLTWDAPDDANPARLAAQRSYDAVGRGAKDEWLALFTPDAVVADPVGRSMFDETGKGHHGREAIAAFWDLTIAPVTRFHFLIKDSFANGPHCANVATFTTELGDGTVAETDLVTIYRVDEAGLIESMHAYWEMERTFASLRQRQ